MILIIDDDNSIRASLSFMLKRARYETTAVASPKEAMAIVRATEPQLILMDMNFSLTTSGDEGLTLLRQVKLFRPHVPVILMTAWGSIELAVKGMKAGAFDFITKPWNNAMLLQRIETALELKSIENGNSVIENSELGMENYDYSCSSKPSSTSSHVDSTSADSTSINSDPINSIPINFTPADSTSINSDPIYSIPINFTPADSISNNSTPVVETRPVTSPQSAECNHNSQFPIPNSQFPDGNHNSQLSTLNYQLSFDRSFIIGNSKGLTDVLDVVRRVARTNASVLITGESGTGKELIAEALHRNSLRCDEPFVKVNLGGISQSLFESEMFGHKKGAFTDASADRAGRFEMADRGTIFLDEIGDLDIGSQVKLLRVLQDQTFEPLGESHPHKVDVRVVSATNADLQQRIADHTFREDLFYRINLITVHLPALRERREDIPLLARHFADLQCQANHLPPVEFSSDAMALLCRLPYSGNIRELKNLIERTILICGTRLITAAHLQPQIVSPAAAPAVSTDGLTISDIERQTIIDALRRNAYNLSHVALDLGLSRAALYRRLIKYHINYRK